MDESKTPKKWFGKVNGTVSAVIVMAVMVIALVAFVSVQQRRTIVTATTMTQTAVQSQGLETEISQPYPIATPMPPVSVVNINGIVFMGGFLVLLVLAAVLREALRQTK